MATLSVFYFTGGACSGSFATIGGGFVTAGGFLGPGGPGFFGSTFGLKTPDLAGS